MLAQKALSGVARASNRLPDGRWEGRFGRGKIVQMLVGSRAQEVLSAGLDRKSTYGILKKEGSAYVHALLKDLEREGLVVTRRRENYPLLTLTNRGVEVMKGDRGFRMRWPDRARMVKEKAKKSSAAGGIPEIGLEELAFDERLFEKLKEKRNELAAAAGNVPPYVVFSNQTLEFFTRRRPETMEAGLRIRGVGEVKAERYLGDFLEVIRGYEGAE